jgi:hypothetical protein
MPKHKAGDARVTNFINKNNKTNRVKLLVEVNNFLFW